MYDLTAKTCTYTLASYSCQSQSDHLPMLRQITRPLTICRTQLCLQTRQQLLLRSSHRNFTTWPKLLVDTPALAKAIREIQDKFVEAKDEYEVALENQGTTYAVEDNETARAVAGELSTLYEEIMSGQRLTDAEKQTMKEKLSARIRELTSKTSRKLD